MKKGILFVCLGNICRSPAAEGIFRTLAKNEGLDQSFFCDSAGLSESRAGEGADPRMKKHAQARGYELTSRARPFNPREDFETFDLILAMDHSNFGGLLALDAEKKYRSKIRKMTDFCQKAQVDQVPDPYYGGEQGFEEVLNLLEDAVGGMVAILKKEAL